MAPLSRGFGLGLRLTRDSVGGRAVIDRELIHIEDLLAVAATEFPEAVSAVQRIGSSTDTRGAVTTRGRRHWGDFYFVESRFNPFTDKQIHSS